MSIKERESNFELLRIISILMIISSHFVVHGGIKNLESSIWINTFFSKFFILGCIANHIFIILSGYFLVKSKINCKKIISLTLEMTFYSIVFDCLYFFIGKDKSVIMFAKNLLPIFWGNWFIIYYLILYIFSPFINKFVKALSKKHFSTLIVLSIVLVYLLPTISNNSYNFNNHEFFIVDYLIGAYTCLYPISLLEDSKKNKIYLLLASMLGILSIITLLTIGEIFNIDKFIKSAAYFISNDYSILTMIIAYFLFIVFKDIKIGTNRLINYISASSLGIYLIHENVFLRDLIWMRFWPNTLYYDTIFFVPLLITKVFLIFFGCLVIDKLRIILFQKVETSLSNRIYDRFIKNKCDDLEDL